MAKKPKVSAVLDEKAGELTNEEMSEVNKQIDILKTQLTAIQGQIAQLQLTVVQDELSKIKVTLAQLEFWRFQIDDFLNRQFSFKASRM